MGYLDPVLKRELTALPATKLIPQNYRYIGIFTPYYSLCLRRQSWDWGFCRITISQSNILSSSSIVIVICLLVFYIICHIILVSNGTFYFIFILFIVYDFDIIFSPILRVHYFISWIIVHFRNFRCDCGNSKFSGKKCKLCPVCIYFQLRWTQ